MCVCENLFWVKCVWGEACACVGGGCMHYLTSPVMPYYQCKRSIAQPFGLHSDQIRGLHYNHYVSLPVSENAHNS